MRDAVPLYFLDYSFNLDSHNNIQFDPELRPHQMYLKVGDVFKVELIDDRITLVKQDG